MTNYILFHKNIKLCQIDHFSFWSLTTFNRTLESIYEFKHIEHIRKHSDCVANLNSKST